MESDERYKQGQMVEAKRKEQQGQTLGSGFEAHRVITSRLEWMRHPLMICSLPSVVDGDAVHPKRSFVVEGDLPLLGGVDDAPRVVRRRLTHKTPIHERTGEASPPPKKEMAVPLGPSLGCQENIYFPRVGAG